MKHAWIIAGSLFTAAALAFGTYHVVAQLAHEEVTERASFPAEGIDLIDIGADSGSVEVVGDDVEAITVVAEISHGLHRTGHRAAVEGSTLVVRSDCPFIGTWCEVDYRVVIPADLAVTASVDDGRLAVRDVDGHVQIDGDNGSVELTRLSGDVRGGTDNGSVVGTGLRSRLVEADSDNGLVSLTFAEPPDVVRATSNNGRVQVVLPEGAATYRVDVQTDHGSTDVGVRTDPGSDRSVVAETSNGSVTVRYPTG